MATNTIPSTREGTQKDTTVQPERQRAMETGRDVPSRRAAVSRGGSQFGTGAAPFSLMRRISEDMDRLFNEGFGRLGFGLTSPYRGATEWDNLRSSGPGSAAWVPQLETFRRGEHLVIRADLPGIDRDNVNIEVDDDVLTITGSRNEEEHDEADDYFRSERTYGQFFRAVALPEGVNADDIEATFKDGVLEVTIPVPKARPSRGRQVKIR